MHNNNKKLFKNNNLSKILLAASTAMIMGTTSACAAPTGIQNSQNNASYQKDKQMTLTEQARHIQKALASKNYAAITNDIHPTRGVRFSMYGYIDPNDDKTFSREQFAKYLQQSSIRFTWGARDGIGVPLIAPLPDYLEDWVRADTFNQAGTQVTVNDFIGSGNSINNLTDVYEGADFVEFYHEGSEQYGGMDWRVLRLVFDEYQGRRYLVAIINDEWTV